jgi:hypothetical protein
MAKTRVSMYDAMRKYEVAAASVEDFCDRYHRRDMFHDRGVDYMAVDIAEHKDELARCGFTIIPRGTSVTGDTVSYYGTAAPQD